MIRLLLRYTARSLFPSTSLGVGQARSAAVGLMLSRMWFSSVRTGRPLLAALATGWGLIRWLRREKARDPKAVAFKKRVKPGRAVKLRYMDGKAMVREEIIEG